MSDRITVQAYSRLLNAVMLDTVKTLQTCPAAIRRNARKLLVAEPISYALHAQDWIMAATLHRYRLLSAVNFLESSFFDTVCTALGLGPREVYQRLHDKYAASAAEALEMLDKAEADYLIFKAENY